MLGLAKRSNALPSRFRALLEALRAAQRGAARLLASCYQRARTFSAMVAPRRRGIRDVLPLATALFCLGALVAACGGGAANGVASLGKNTSTTADPSVAATTLPPGYSVQKHFQSALKFSACMRSHGVANFPDPSSSGGIEINSNSGINPGSPEFQAAQKVCQKYLGPRPTATQQAQAQRRALAFAACMRAHGVPNFSDPTFGPNGSIKQAVGPGAVDPNSSVFQNATQKCNS